MRDRQVLRLFKRINFLKKVISIKIDSNIINTIITDILSKNNLHGIVLNNKINKLLIYNQEIVLNNVINKFIDILSLDISTTDIWESRTNAIKILAGLNNQDEVINVLIKKLDYLIKEKRKDLKSELTDRHRRWFSEEISFATKYYIRNDPHSILMRNYGQFLIVLTTLGNKYGFDKEKIIKKVIDINDIEEVFETRISNSWIIIQRLTAKKDLKTDFDLLNKISNHIENDIKTTSPGMDAFIKEYFGCLRFIKKK